MAYIGRAPTYGLFQTQSITADSSNTIFNLNYGVSSASSMLVSVGGVVQEPDVAYTVGTGGQTIVFSEAPETGAGVFIIYLGQKYDVPTFANSAVTTAMIADNSITSAKIADNSITSAKIANSAVTTAMIADNSITSAKIADSAVTTAMIADNSITSAKIANGTVIAADVLDDTLSNTKLQLYTVTTDRLSNTGVVSATYGNATIIPSFVVDTGGRITSASNVAVDFVRPSIASTFTAAQTFRAANAIRSEAATTQDAVVIAGRAGGTSSYAVTLTPTTLSASRTLTLPNNDINFTTGLGVANGGTGTNTLTANNVILGNGASAVQFVAPGTSGNVLTSNGTSWGSQAISAGGLTLIGSLTLGDSAYSISLPAGWNTTYKYLLLMYQGVYVSPAGSAAVYMGFNNDQSSVYSYSWIGYNSGTAIIGTQAMVGPPIDNSQTTSAFLKMQYFPSESVTYRMRIMGTVYVMNRIHTWGGSYETTSAPHTFNWQQRVGPGYYLSGALALYGAK